MGRLYPESLSITGLLSHLSCLFTKSCLISLVSTIVSLAMMWPSFTVFSYCCEWATCVSVFFESVLYLFIYKNFNLKRVMFVYIGEITEI